MATSEAITLLRRIAAAVELIAGMRTSAAPGGDVADDRDLDGQYGNPEVKFNPRDWQGDSCKGLRMSDCPAAFLDLLAGTFDYFARKADESGEVTNSGKPVAPYKRKDAARARGWAKRVRARGDVAVAALQSSGFGVSGVEWPEDSSDNDIPF